VDGLCFLLEIAHLLKGKLAEDVIRQITFEIDHDHRQKAQPWVAHQLNWRRKRASTSGPAASNSVATSTMPQRAPLQTAYLLAELALIGHGACQKNRSADRSAVALVAASQNGRVLARSPPA
jgi:hypothetical protein